MIRINSTNRIANSLDHCQRSGPLQLDAKGNWYVREDRDSYYLRYDPCVWCGQLPTRATDYRHSIEHIVPRAFGGTRHWTNAAAACAQCNNERGLTPLLHTLIERGKG